MSFCHCLDSPKQSCSELFRYIAQLFANKKLILQTEIFQKYFQLFLQITKKQVYTEFIIKN